MVFILRRLKVCITLLFIVSIIVFLLIKIQPVNPFVNMVSADTDPQYIERRMEELGYNDPLPIQYLKWVGRVLQGDLGYSIQYKIPVAELIASRMANSLLLSGTAFILSIVWGCLLGTLTATKQNRMLDRILSTIAFIFISIPSFFLALLIIKVFSYDLGILPPSGLKSPRLSSMQISPFLDTILHIILPVGLLSTIYTATNMRYVRSLMLTEMSQNYMSAMKIKGISRRRLIWLHGFRNILAPVITLMAMQFPALLSGAAVTETIFVWPGIGKLSYDASMSKDYPVVMGVTMVMAVIVIGANLIADILNIVIHPKLRLE